MDLSPYRFVDFWHQSAEDWERVPVAEIGERVKETKGAKMSAQLFKTPTYRGVEDHWLAGFFRFIFDDDTKEVAFDEMLLVVKDLESKGCLRETLDVRLFYDGIDALEISFNPAPLGASPSPTLILANRVAAETLGRELSLRTLDLSCYHHRAMLSVPGAEQPNGNRSKILLLEEGTSVYQALEADDLLDFPVPDFRLFGFDSKLHHETTWWEFCLKKANEDGATRVALSAKEARRVTIDEAITASAYDELVEWDGTVVAVSDRPQLSPKSVEFTCSPVPESRLCGNCHYVGGGGRSFTLSPISKVTAELLSSRDLTKELRLVLSRQIGVPKNCPAGNFRIQDCYSMYFASAQAPFSQTQIFDQSQSMSSALVFSADPLEAQKTYTFKGKTLPHPRNAESITLAFQAKKSLKTYEDFRLTTEAIDRLTQFQGDPEVVIDRVQKSLEHHVHGIRGRYWHSVAAMLTWHSSIGFQMMGQTHRGWLTSLFYGDTSQGKSTLLQRLLEFYLRGAIAHCENASYPGLMMGVEKLVNKHTTRYGLLPLNDKQLVILEEYPRLNEDIRRSMSEQRTSGKIIMNKIVKGYALSRVRQNLVSNAIDAHGDTVPMRSVAFSVSFCQEIMKSIEDVRRLDIAVPFAENKQVISNIFEKVSLNGSTGPEPDREAHQMLIDFIWGREANQVHVTEESAELIRMTASHWSNVFVSTIPLMESGDSMGKLGRWATAVAGQCFSTTPDHAGILVLPEHVNFAVAMLETIYNSAESGYMAFSKNEKDFEAVAKRDIVKIARQMGDNLDGDMAWRAIEYCVNTTEPIQWHTLSVVCGMERPQLFSFFGGLKKCGGCKQYGREVVITRIGTEIMMEFLRWRSAQAMSGNDNPDLSDYTKEG